MAAVAISKPGDGAENQPPQSPWHQNLNTRLICPDCKLDPPQFIEENADTICANCGLVLAERLISMESEWRTFNSDDNRGEDPNRVGEADNELLGQSNVGTTIAGGPNSSKEMKRLRRAQNEQTDAKKDKELSSAYTIIDAWADRADIPANVNSKPRGSTRMFTTPTPFAARVGMLYWPAVSSLPAVKRITVAPSLKCSA